MNRFLFIHVNKCGGTSIKRMLKDTTNVNIAEGLILDNLHKMFYESYEKHIKFAVVRDPYTRIRSASNMFKSKKLPHSIDFILDCVENDKINYSFINMHIEKTAYIKRHCLPMTHKHYCLYDEKQGIIVDKIYKFEEFDKAINDISNLIGQVLLPVHLNKSRNKNEVEFTKEQIERINNIYNKDFEIFEYKIKNT